MISQALPRVPSDRREAYLALLCDALIGEDDLVAAYERVPDKPYAFDYFAGELAYQENAEQLARLLEKHRAAHADDANLDYYQGELHSLRDEWEQAEQAYRLGMAQATDEDSRDNFRVSIVYAMYHGGKSLEALAELPPAEKTFEQLAYLASGDEDAPLLASLAKAFRQQSPDQHWAALWEGESAWLQKDYQRTVELLLSQRNAIREHDEIEYQYRYMDRLIRSYVRLGQLAAARREAKHSTEYDQDPYYEALVAAAAGDVDQTTTLLEQLQREQDYVIDDLYGDEDMSRALEQPAFADWRKENPPPQ